MGLLAGGEAQPLLHHRTKGQPQEQHTLERKSFTFGLQQWNWPTKTAASCTTMPGRSVPPQGEVHPWSGMGEKVRGPARRGWKQAGLPYSPVCAGQLVGGRRRDERSAAVPVAGMSTARQWRRHLQQGHVGGGQVRALARPWAVGGRAGRRGLGHRLGGRRLRAGSGEECGL